MKAGLISLCLALTLSLSTTDARAQFVTSEWSLYDSRTSQTAEPLRHGHRIDKRNDQNHHDVQVSFNFAGWGGGASGYLDRVEWSIQHSGRSYVATRTTRTPEADGSYLMCRGRRCTDFMLEGDVTITARAIYDSGSVVAVMGTGSRSLRVVDTTPLVREKPSGGPSVPYCYGNQDVCDETVANAGLWRALTSLCDQMEPGATFSLGNGASIKCP